MRFKKNFRLFFVFSNILDSESPKPFSNPGKRRINTDFARFAKTFFRTVETDIKRVLKLCLTVFGKFKKRIFFY